jgi:CheY-like chemotaxis protein
MEGARLQDEQKRTRAEAPVGPPVKSVDAGMPPPDAETSFGDMGEGDGQPALSAGQTAFGEPEPVRAELTGQEQEFSSVQEALAYYEAREPREAEEAAPGPESPDAPAPEGIPAETASPRPAPREAGVEAPGQTGPQAARGGQGPLLVIIDDDGFMLESMAHHLAAKGYRTRSFSEAGPALKYIQEAVDVGGRPDAVIVDLIMPDTAGGSTLGGLEILERTRKTSPDISVYMMTDYENNAARQRADEVGARFFFMKPKSSQLDGDYGSPELLNFIAVLENALASEEKPASEDTAPREAGMVNLGEELRREFGEDVIPIHPEIEYLTPSRGLRMLKAMISELNDPNSSGQITLLVLRFAAELMNRAIIFLVAKNQLAGLGQFGIELDGADPQKHVRRIRIPLNQPSIFREAIQKRLPLKKALKETKINKQLVETLGGKRPTEVFVAPIIAGGKIAAILYGDNVPEEKDIGDTESLEIFLVQAGQAMEKALLERRLKEMGGGPDSS